MIGVAATADIAAALALSSTVSAANPILRELFVWLLSLPLMRSLIGLKHRYLNSRQKNEVGYPATTKNSRDMC